MFAKLLKYEWKANAGLLWILSACALGVGLLGAGIIRAIDYISNKMLNDQMAAIATTGLGSIMVFVVIALAAYALAVQFINIFRFYKNKFTDEGYLTFTLPVTTHQIFLSSLLVILAWLAISVVVLVISISLMAIIGTGASIKEVWDGIVMIVKGLVEGFAYLEEFGMPGVSAYIIMCVAQVFVAPVYAIVLLMTSITLGCVLAKKHKILASIGMYYVINMAVNVISSILTIVPTLMMIGSAMSGSEDYFKHMTLAMVLALLLQVGLSVAGYFWSTWLMKHKLNLP